jgi:imidazole glycerol phosphate synthase glutamine amidotransferase subunit
MLGAGDALRMLQRCPAERSASIDEGAIVTAIFDYGAGNLRSVQNSLDAIGSSYELVRSADGLERASKIILPGVGHFGQMLRALDELGARETLIARIHAGVPFLGICLGLQAMFEKSEEAPDQRGLGIFPGTVKQFDSTLRVPHMGWNQIAEVKPSKLLAGITPMSYVYFAHSYYVPLVEQAVATCTYSLPYAAVVESGNVFGVQCHPEKSGAVGLKLLRNFMDLPC